MRAKRWHGVVIWVSVALLGVGGVAAIWGPTLWQWTHPPPPREAESLTPDAG